jgi:peptidoglycan-N-acetylglucosamine deacetylase
MLDITMYLTPLQHAGVAVAPGLALPYLLRVANRRVLGTLTHVKTKEEVAAITFDDGPHPKATPEILNILAQHEAKATFFMLGKAAHRYPEIVQQVAEAGHVVANHSWDHPSFVSIPSEERRRQIAECQRVLAPYGQRLFRPPFGRQSMASRLDVWRLGYSVVTWNVEVGDWWDSNSERMVDRLVAGVRPGSIIVLHDSIDRAPVVMQEPELTRTPLADREPMLKALRSYLSRSAGRFRFVGLPELISCGQPIQEGWYRD